ncbi:uncharacterized protein BDZ99DRAFT_210939 [Mytilinidion resinicola]|uniref:3CxxC-type domain-containing protein n=1 Tax=Mytilinidion resinicola TaxID=574789 RepID=A0A6A6Y0M6_9PEZI|nr:uncharacterized protein BDZ99DRAFT_210939 [Mytilinidion resinicola]KAF2802200.1 hypothetical protein BDZ99DRAFT_210939 [Mytilinidion resinicola]
MLSAVTSQTFSNREHASPRTYDLSPVHDARRSFRECMRQAYDNSYMTGLRANLIRANFIHNYAIIRTHLNEIILTRGDERSTILIMSTNRRGSTKKWSMYPSLHNDVSDLLREHNLFFQFYDEDDDNSNSCTNDYDTTIMGLFICRNRQCPVQIWQSGQIAITIRRYSDMRYNARVYHQSCKSCGTLSRPKLGRSYAERVAYRIKKWCGVQMDAPPFSGRSDGPHRSDLCEGCKQGHCSQTGLWF